MLFLLSFCFKPTAQCLHRIRAYMGKVSVERMQLLSIFMMKLKKLLTCVCRYVCVCATLLAITFLAAAIIETETETEI